MPTLKSCSGISRGMQRCHVPLIEICDATSQLKLDLGSCDACQHGDTALLLRKGGCPEWETVCDPLPSTPCCGAGASTTYGHRRVVEKPKPSIIYPLHEVDAAGMSVYVLDGKLNKLGYGRYNAFILLVDNVNNGGDTYSHTGIAFDIDYVKSKINLGGIELATFQPNLGEC